MFLQLLNKITVPFVAYSNVLMRFKGAKVSVDRLEELILEEKISDTSISGFDPVPAVHQSDSEIPLTSLVDNYAP